MGNTSSILCLGKEIEDEKSSNRLTRGPADSNLIVEPISELNELSDCDTFSRSDVIFECFDILIMDKEYLQMEKRKPESKKKCNYKTIEIYKEMFNDNEFKKLLLFKVESNEIKRIKFLNCSLSVTKTVKISRFKNDKCVKIHSISFESCAFDKNTVINICNSIDELSSLDLSKNKIRPIDAQNICNELKHLDFIYMYENQFDLSSVTAPNLIF